MNYRFIRNYIAILLPLVAVCVFIVAFIFYFSAAGMGDVDAEYLQEKANGVEYFYRVLWFVSAVATGCGASLVAAISISFTLNLLKPSNQVRLYASCGGLLLVVLILLHFNDMSGGAGAAFAAQIQSEIGPSVDMAVEFTMNLAATAIFLLVVNACALIAKSRQSLDISTIADCFKKFRISLLATSFFLVVGTLHIMALYKWAVHVPIEKGVVPIVANGLAVGSGAIYSILLLSVYVPVSYQLNQRSALLLTKEVTSDDPDDVERWQKRYGLFNSPARVVGRYLLMAAPMIAGAVIDMILPLH
jgi:hypothetical protein